MIGVILMVAVVVVLAATVGGLVFGLAESPTETPTASFDVEDADDNLTDVPPGAVRDLIVLEHRGGDPLPAADYFVRIKNPGNGLAELNSTAPARINVAADVRLASDTSRLSVGDRVVVEIVSTHGYDFTAVGEWRIAVVHRPSETIVYDREVRLT